MANDKYSVEASVTSLNIAEELEQDLLEKIGDLVHDGYTIDEGSREEWLTKNDEYLKLATPYNDHGDHIRKVIGYLAHQYKDETIGYIIVLTEHLIGTGGATPLYEGEDLGRYIIRLQYDQNLDIVIVNRDFQDFEGYYHPHIIHSGSVCWGNVETDLVRMLKLGQLDLAVDLIIRFLAEIPHLEGSPYSPYAEWKEEKCQAKDTEKYLEERA